MERQHSVPSILELTNHQLTPLIVTGGGRGLGKEFVTAFALSGAKHSIVADINLTAAKITCDFIKEEVGQALGIRTDSEEMPEVSALEVDVTDEESVQAMVAQAEDRMRSIDVLVTAAGICQNIPAEEYSLEDFKKVFDVNVNGTFLCAREVAKGMIASGSGGSIIFISSMSARIVNRPQPQCAYNASKAAVSHLARSMAAEWAEHGIRVNSLAPGYQMTTLLEGVLEREGPGLKNGWETLTPMRRLGIPRELRSKVVFLASEAGSFMTGQDLVVDGGYEIW